MRGDLHTLKKVCLYGSKAMLLGEAVLGIVIAALVVLGIGSLVSDGISSTLGDLIDSDPDDSDGFSARWLEVVSVFLLGLATVHVIRVVMVSIHQEHSPFTEANTSVVVSLSKVYPFAAVVLAVLEWIASGNIAFVVFLFFGCILIAVVLYVLALMIRYGSVLQDEWDHTL